MDPIHIDYIITFNGSRTRRQEIRFSRISVSTLHFYSMPSTRSHSRSHPHNYSHDRPRLIRCDFPQPFPSALTIRFDVSTSTAWRRKLECQPSAPLSSVRRSSITPPRQVILRFRLPFVRRVNHHHVPSAGTRHDDCKMDPRVSVEEEGCDGLEIWIRKSVALSGPAEGLAIRKEDVSYAGDYNGRIEQTRSSGVKIFTLLSRGEVFVDVVFMAVSWWGSCLRCCKRWVSQKNGQVEPD